MNGCNNNNFGKVTCSIASNVLSEEGVADMDDDSSEDKQRSVRNPNKLRNFS